MKRSIQVTMWSMAAAALLVAPVMAQQVKIGVVGDSNGALVAKRDGPSRCLLDGERFVVAGEEVHGVVTHWPSLRANAPPHTA